MTSSRITGLALALSLAAIAQGATAQPFTLRQGYSPDSSKAVTEALVPLDGIDLASSAGAAELLWKIEAAADAVCRSERAATQAELADLRECRRMAISGAVGRMRNPALSALAQDLVR